MSNVILVWLTLSNLMCTLKIVCRCLSLTNMTPNWTWRLNCQKYSIYTYPWGPNFSPFCSTISCFQDTCTRSMKIGNALNDPKLNLNTWQSKVPCIHQYWPQRSKFWSISLYDKQFRRFILPHIYFHILYFPWLTTMLNGQRKKKYQKLKILNFATGILLTTLIETLPRHIHEFWRVNLMCSFRGNVVWNFYSLSERKRKNVQHFEKQHY